MTKDRHYLQNLQSRANETIAHGSLTNSKHPRSLIEGVYPTHVKSGFKCYLIDSNGHRYIDFICGLGTNYFGYSNPDLQQVITNCSNTGGSVFSLPSEEEVILGEKLQGTFPFLERMRFLKTGSEGCSASVRIARSFTGKQYVESLGYHGHHDLFVSLTPPASGIMDDHYICNYGDYFGDFPENYDDEIACVIIEPVDLEFSDQRIAWLQNIRGKCTKHNVVLIFDETITAYRFKDLSVAKATGIYPDIWVGGKVLAGGLPISVVGGKKEIMESDYFVSSTWAGDRFAINAAIKANDLVHDVFHPNQLWEQGKLFLDRFNSLSTKIQIEGYPTRGVFKADDDIFKALFWQECCKAGVLFGASWFYNRWLHMEMDNVISICKSVIKNIEDGKVRLEGKMPISPFAQKMRKSNGT